MAPTISLSDIARVPSAASSLRLVSALYAYTHKTVCLSVSRGSTVSHVSVTSTLTQLSVKYLYIYNVQRSSLASTLFFSLFLSFSLPLDFRFVDSWFDPPEGEEKPVVRVIEGRSELSPWYFILFVHTYNWTWYFSGGKYSIPENMWFLWIYGTLPWLHIVRKKSCRGYRSPLTASHKRRYVAAELNHDIGWGNFDRIRYGKEVYVFWRTILEEETLEKTTFRHRRQNDWWELREEHG